MFFDGRLKKIITIIIFSIFSSFIFEYIDADLSWLLFLRSQLVYIRIPYISGVLSTCLIYIFSVFNGCWSAGRGRRMHRL